MLPDKNPESVQPTAEQLQRALYYVFLSLDRICANPKSVVPWTTEDLIVLAAARSLVPELNAKKGGAS